MGRLVSYSADMVWILSLLPLFGLSFLPQAEVSSSTPQKEAGLMVDSEAWLTFYQDLHQHPELSLQETNTAKKLASALRKAGFQVTEGVGGTGVVGLLKNGEGPTLLLRTDMDALPLEEKTGLAFASKVRVDVENQETGVMHACGHDIHMTVWAATATYLSAHPELWSGTLMMVAQPAEEIGMGARAMLDDGLYSRFGRPDYCLALHVTGELPVGVLGSCAGYALANVDSVDIHVKGKGGHGSKPEQTHDPIVLAARIVLGLQTIVSREVPPQESAVISVGSIHGGAKHNIIPDEVHLKITVRSYKPEIRELLLKAIQRTAEGEAFAAGFPAELKPEVRVSEEEYTPSTYNTPDLVQIVNQRWRKKLGPQAVVETKPVMGGEDFGRYGPRANCPSYIFWLGVSPLDLWQQAQNDGPSCPSIHNSYFAPDAAHAIPVGVDAMSQAVFALLPSAGS